jgi:hypothetical protein
LFRIVLEKSKELLVTLHAQVVKAESDFAVKNRVEAAQGAKKTNLTFGDLPDPHAVLVPDRKFNRPSHFMTEAPPSIPKAAPPTREFKPSEQEFQAAIEQAETALRSLSKDDIL